MARYIPQLDGKVDPAVARAIRDLYEKHYALSATQDSQGSAMAQIPTRLSAAQNFMNKIAALPAFSFMLNGSSQSVFGSQGSIPPIISGAFTYDNSVAAQIIWTWTGLLLSPPHLALAGVKTISIPDGSQTITGLIAGHTYYFAPYYDLKQRLLLWSAPANTGAVGTPAIAYDVSPNVTAAQFAIADGHVNLASKVAMAAAATGGGGGGGGGGGRGTL